MDERLQFILDAQSDRFTMAELCARYGVSRRIGYKWLARYAEEGKRGLADRSRAPHTCPHKIRPVLAELLCEFRRSHPDWGCQSTSQIPHFPTSEIPHPLLWRAVWKTRMWWR
jgi:putative transposase